MRRNKEWDVQQVLVRILDSRMRVEGLGKRKTISKREAVLQTMMSKAAAGDSAITQLLIQYHEGRGGKLRRGVRDEEADRKYLEIIDEKLRIEKERRAANEQG